RASTFVATTIAPRDPTARPTICSATPYAGAVSISVTPAAIACRTIATASSSRGRTAPPGAAMPYSAPSPAVPSDSALTLSPVRPSGRCVTGSAERRDDLGHRVDDVGDVARRHAGKERQREHRFVGGFRDRAEPRADAEPPAVERMEVHRNVVNVDADAFAPQRREHRRAIA